MKDDEISYPRKEAAKYIGVAYETLANWKSNGKYFIPCYKYMGKFYYYKFDLDNFKKKHKIRLVNQ